MSDSETYTDDDLVRGLSLGDKDAFTAIYKKYWKDLYYYSLAILGEELLADDCVQEVFLSLWKRREEVDIKNIHAYLKQSVRFQVLWLIRTKKISKECFHRISAAATQAVIDDPYLFKETATIYREVVESLPPDQKEIFKLAREEGLSAKQISNHTGIPLRTVERKISLSLKNVRMKLSELLHAIFLY